MVTPEQMKEIKENIVCLKENLLRSLFEIVMIDEFELKKADTITFNKANQIRKKVSSLKSTVANKFSILNSFLENNFLNKE